MIKVKMIITYRDQRILNLIPIYDNHFQFSICTLTLTNNVISSINNKNQIKIIVYIKTDFKYIFLHILAPNLKSVYV